MSLVPIIDTSAMNCQEYVALLYERLAHCRNTPIGLSSALSTIATAEYDSTFGTERNFFEAGCASLIAYKAAEQTAQSCWSRGAKRKPVMRQLLHSLAQESIATRTEVATQLAAIIEPANEARFRKLLQDSCKRRKSDSPLPCITF